MAPNLTLSTGRSSSTEREAAAFLVTGRVQGVGFRAWTASRARFFGITGWVRNTSDGSVELHAEGDASALAAFQSELEQGPPLSRVNAIIRHPATFRGHTRFNIVH